MKKALEFLRKLVRLISAIIIIILAPYVAGYPFMFFIDKEMVHIQETPEFCVLSWFLGFCLIGFTAILIIVARNVFDDL